MTVWDAGTAEKLIVTAPGLTVIEFMVRAEVPESETVLPVVWPVGLLQPDGVVEAVIVSLEVTLEGTLPCR